MNKIDTVLFDFDGTIMDTNNVILMSWQHTFRTLENREEDEKKLTATFGEPLERTLERFFPNVPVEESIEVYRSYQRTNFRDLITLFPGMKELVIECKAYQRVESNRIRCVLVIVITKLCKSLCICFGEIELLNQAIDCYKNLINIISIEMFQKVCNVSFDIVINSVFAINIDTYIETTAK